LKNPRTFVCTAAIRCTDGSKDDLKLQNCCVVIALLAVCAVWKEVEILTWAISTDPSFTNCSEGN